MMKLEKLYRKTKPGKTVYVQMYTRKNKGDVSYTMYTETGTVGNEANAKTSKVVVSEGKNLGRKNATTPKQQAEKEMIARHTKLFAKGYKLNINYVQKNTYNTFKDLSAMPMLLNPYKESSGVFKPGFAQRKYDGCRNLAEKHNGIMRNKSREGKVFNLQHILDSVTELHNKQLAETFDGELYLHNVALQDIGSMVKSNDPNKKLQYHIYDIAIEGLTFTQRRNLLLALDVSKFPNIKVDAGVPINTEQELIDFHKESLELGFEGTIFCDPDSMYDFGFRTSGKKKIKPRVTDEFKCISHYMNKGKMSKQSTLICQTKDGEKFHVKMKGTREQREKWASEFETKFKDKMVTAEFRKLSNKGVPLEAVGIAVRDYE